MYHKSAQSVHMQTQCALFQKIISGLHKVCTYSLHEVCICRLNAHSFSLRSLNLAYNLKSAQSLHIMSASSMHLQTLCTLIEPTILSVHKVCIQSMQKVCICRLNAYYIC